MAELAASLTISRGGLTKLADRVEHAGCIRREPAGEDGRGLYAVLTADGNTLLRRMWPVYSRALSDTFVSAVTEEEAATIAAALRRVGNHGRNADAAAGRQGPR